MDKKDAYEVTSFHPRVHAWLRRLGFTNIQHEPYIGRKEPDFVVNYRNWYAIVECKLSCTKSGVESAITQLGRYRNEIKRLLAYPDHYNYSTAIQYRNANLIYCLAIETLISITFADAFALCADKGVLLLNPGYDYKDSRKRFLKSRYPYVATQLPLFDKERP